MTLDDVLNIIVAVSAENKASSTPVPVKLDSKLLYRKDGFDLYVSPVMHANELQFWIEAQNLQTKFRQDAIQAWLGLPLSAIMFNGATVRSVSGLLVDTINSVFERLSVSKTDSIAGLEASGNAISEDSSRERLRQEANAAWKMARYQDAADLYRKLGPNLSKSEVKRLQISERRFGK